MSRHLGRTLVVFLTALAAGCSGGGGSHGSSGGSSASTATPTTSSMTRIASTTSATTTTRGTTTTTTTVPTRGTATSGSTSTTTTTSVAPTSNGPQISVTSPARASFATSATANVAGTVTDTLPIVNLTVNGNVVQVGTGGAFSEAVTLTEGLNVIKVLATNQAGQSNETSLSVIYGTYGAATSNVANAVTARLNAGMFTAVDALAATQLTGDKLAAIVTAKSPLTTLSILGTNCNISASSASFGNPTLTLTPNNGYLDVNVQIPNVALAIQETNSSFLIPNFSANPTCDLAVVDAQIAISVANGVVTTSVVNDTVNLTNFQLNGNGIIGTVAGWFNGSVSGLVQSQIQTMIKSVLPQQVNQMIAGATGAPISQTILGTTASITLAPSAITIDANGLTATSGGDITIAPVNGFAGFPQAPGSLITTGAPPTYTGTQDFYVGMNQDLMNRIGYGVWQSGLTQLTIDGSANSLIQLPSWIPLDMGLLETFLTELQGKASPSDAISLVVAPQLPPIVTPAAAPNNFTASIGELQIQVWDTTTNVMVLSLAVQTSVSADATVNASNTFDVAISQAPIFDVSLASSPLAPDLNITGVTNFVNFAIPPVVQILGNVWQGFPLPVYPGLNLNTISLYQDGAAGNFLTVAGNAH